MVSIKIIIEKTEDLYTAYAENVAGIYAGGETVAEVKEAVVEAIRLLQEVNPPEQLPAALKGTYELVYNFDTESFLNYYKGILSFSALEKLTGINQKQLQHYSSGHRKPKQEQKKKIEAALHKLGQELLEVEL